jgi:hypothetical protein
MTAPAGSASASEPDLVEVVLIDLPVATLLRSRAYNHEMFRELQLIAASGSELKHESSARLVALSHELTQRYGPFVESATAEIDVAAERGDRTITLRLQLPADIVEAVRHYNGILDEIDQFSRSGELITRPAPPDVHRLRVWSLDQIVGQITVGLGPEPFPGDDDE